MTGIHDLASGGHATPHARVVFTAFRGADNPMLLAWARFREPLVVATTSDAEYVSRNERHTNTPSISSRPPADIASGLWRLLATNNRELGRSYLLYKTFEMAREHVVRLQQRATDLEVMVVLGPGKVSHGWILTLEGTPVMTCGRWYTSTSAMTASVAGMLAALPSAVLAADVDRPAPSGRLSRRLVSSGHVRSW